MTYTNKHHSKSRAYSRQSDTSIEQNLPTQKHVRTDPRTAIKPIAGLLRSLPLTAGKPGTSRDPARQPAQPKAVGHNHPTHQHSRVIWKQESRTKSHRPNTGTQPKTSGRTSGRGEQLYPENSESSEALGQRPLRGVRQDKGSLKRALSASQQPAPLSKGGRAHFVNKDSPRSQNFLSSQSLSKGRATLVHSTIWQHPQVHAELTRIAAEEHLSFSQVGALACEQWLHQRLHDQHEALLYPTIRNLIREENRAFGNRLVFFLMRIAFAAEQTRILVTNILSRFLKIHGVPNEVFTDLVDQSSKMAKRNIIKKTPQLESLLQQWEGFGKWETGFAETTN